MIYAIASGKGGTGKTTVASSLVSLWGDPVTAVDLDVEEPNLHLFLKPEISRIDPAYIEIPEADESKCTLCRECSTLCQFKAITVMGDTLLIFPEMCHGCGGCLAICPEGALSPGRRQLGEICHGRAGGTRFVMGRLRVGEAMSPPLMRQVKALFADIAAADNGSDIIVDAPPGVSCPAVSAVIDADCVVLVTEPTPFGLHDFKLAWEAFSPFGKPMGAVINRAGIGDDSVKRFCADKGIPVWAEIPFDRAVAEAYSRGEVVAEAVAPLRGTFRQLRNNMREAVREKVAACAR
ncbi:4Fe-4S dicluster domain-containing protein [Pseudodesulfovibrio sp. F-1]|uniref:4Fe-4S dicluster domain-containing protein n=1 Tax=Pseudodesulfovibrio alkaliphilus TaxID=2661613 RepID=A0A7K1KLZ8_9BACT|nr:4Fe-4S dicluster domain-containing protein [Pseudodesulfovibrio alkaliphilus]